MTALGLSLCLLHENAVSSSRMELRDREVTVTFSFTLEEVGGLVRLDVDRDGRVDRTEWALAFPLLRTYVAERFEIENDGERCAALPDDGALPRDTSLSDLRAPVSMALRYAASKPFSRVAVVLPEQVAADADPGKRRQPPACDGTQRRPGRRL